MAVRTRVQQSSRSGTGPVKGRPRHAGWKGHVEGWQAGLLAVAIAGTAAVLGVPRPVPPGDLPEPAVAEGALDDILRADEARARSVTPPGEPRTWLARLREGREARTLDHDVRALGDAVRAFGRAESDADEAALEKARRAAVDAAGAAIARAPEDVLVLRAYQVHAFAAGMRQLERTGEASPDLVELAGTFPRAAEMYGWYDRGARRLRVDEPALRAMYKKRWNEVTGLTGAAFALALDEERALLRFLLAHPAVPRRAPPPGAGPDAARAHALAMTVLANEKRLSKIRDLARIDPGYPAAFAEGVVLFRLGRFEQAAIAFERHLEAHPDGPWTLRARNHLKAALEAR